MRSIITGCSGTIVVNLAIPAPLQKDLEAMKAISYFHIIKKSRIKRIFFKNVGSRDVFYHTVSQIQTLFYTF